MFTKVTKFDGEYQAMHTLMGDITQDSCKQAIQWIIDCNMNDASNPDEPRPDILNLIISSDGGDFYAAFALIDFIASSHIPVRTIATGVVASCGLFISMSGTPGHRVATPNTSFLSHHFSAESEGNNYQLMSQLKGFKDSNKILVNHYKKHTGLTEKEILDNLLRPVDVYLNANEAKSYRLCDVVKNLN